MHYFVKARADCGCEPIMSFDFGPDTGPLPVAVCVDSLTFCRVHARPWKMEELAVLLQDANDQARRAGRARQRAEQALLRARAPTRAE